VIKTFKIILVLVFLGSLSACGFHLRKENISALPAELSEIKLKIINIKYAALLDNLFIDEWQQAGGVVSENNQNPVLIIDGERVVRRVLSVSPADAKVSEYSLKYVLSFRLVGPNNKKTLIRQKIHLQRQYTVDVDNVLAKEHEQTWLTNAMRQQAIKRMVRSVSHISTEALATMNTGAAAGNEQK